MLLVPQWIHVHMSVYAFFEFLWFTREGGPRLLGRFSSLPLVLAVTCSVFASSSTGKLGSTGR